jgi:hypothetical protein
MSFWAELLMIPLPDAKLPEVPKKKVKTKTES